MKKTSRPPLAICYRVIAPNGKISYFLGTQHCYYKCPKELEKLKLGRILVEVDDFKIPQTLPRRLLDQQIVTMAYSKDIPVIALDDDENLKEILSERDETNHSDLDSLFEPDAFKYAHRILNRMRSPDDYYQIQDLKKLNLEPDPIYDLELNKKICDGRNSKWEKMIFDKLEEGNVLVAVGFDHLLADGGYRDILTKKDYKLEPYPVTIEKDTDEIEKALKKLPYQALDESLFKEMKRNMLPTQLKLRQLVIAYHQKKPLTAAQKRRINECIYRGLQRKEYCHFNFLKDYHLKQSVYLSGYSLLDFYSKHIHLLFQGASKENIQDSVFNFFKEQKESAIPTRSNLGEQQRIAFIICLFFPDIAKNLVKLLFAEKQYQAIELLILFGASIDETNEDQVKFYQGIIKSLPEEKSPAMKQSSAATQDKNIPGWLMEIVKKTAEADCWFLEDIKHDLFTEHLPKLKQPEISSLIKLFDQYKNANSWQNQSWQVKILLQKILSTLTQPPYRNESAMLALSGYYNQQIEKLNYLELINGDCADVNSAQVEYEFFAVKKHIFMFSDEIIRIKYSKINDLFFECPPYGSSLQVEVRNLLRGLEWMKNSEQKGIVSIPKIIFMTVKAEILQRLDKESAGFFSFFQSADNKKVIAAIKKGLTEIEKTPATPEESDDESDSSDEELETSSSLQTSI